MPMLKVPPPANAQAYVDAQPDWQRRCVEALRAAVLSLGTLEERVKWGHLVYFANGPVLLIRAEPQRLLFGFWRGRRLRAIEPRLRPGGQYEMATLALDPQTPLARDTVLALAREAVALNAALGDPTRVVR